MCLVNYDELGKSAMHEAIVHCVELQGRKFPEKVIQVNNTTFTHTSTKGITKTFRCYGYGWNAYAPHVNDEGKLYKVMGFYIIEET